MNNQLFPYPISSKFREEEKDIVSVPTTKGINNVKFQKARMPDIFELLIAGSGVAIALFLINKKIIQEIL